MQVSGGQAVGRTGQMSQGKPSWATNSCQEGSQTLVSDYTFGGHAASLGTEHLAETMQPIPSAWVGTPTSVHYVDKLCWKY